MKEHLSQSTLPVEDTETPGDETSPVTVDNAEANSPSEDNVKIPGSKSSKAQQHEALTTAYLHFKDEEQLSSMQPPEEENEKNNAKELSS